MHSYIIQMKGKMSKHLKIIFEKIVEVGLKLKLLKCAFFNCHLHYLGHLISGEGMYILKER